MGSPGSARIATALAQIVNRIVDAGQSLPEAVAAPRFHVGNTGKLLIELKRFSPEVIEALSQTGFQVTKRGAYSFYLGSIQAVQLPQHFGESFIGVADPRRDGRAKGPEKIVLQEE
jgi:gamma-glutamyltranspeptidase/glutathione hydrolase